MKLTIVVNTLTEASEVVPADALSYATSKCALGHVLVARSAKGVCAILMGDDSAYLEADLAGSFPEAGLIAKLSAVRDDLAKVALLPGESHRRRSPSHARHARQRVPATCLGEIARDLCRQDRDVHGAGPLDQPARLAPRRRSRLCRRIAKKAHSKAHSSGAASRLGVGSARGAKAGSPRLWTLVSPM
jgi:hypothetical protein